LNKHIERLKKIKDTTFESYDNDTGVWTFSVEHFTTYGLEYDEDETEAEVANRTSTAKAPQFANSQDFVLDEAPSPDDPDDTFSFRRKGRAVPGAFDMIELSDNEEDMVEKLALPPVTWASSLELEAPTSATMQEVEAIVEDVNTPLKESATPPHEQQSAAGLDWDRPAHDSTSSPHPMPAGIMRARMRAIRKSAAPTKIQVTGGDDWTRILQESAMAPRTVDRAQLRAMNESGAYYEQGKRGSPAPRGRDVSDERGFATSIDLMKSLFEQAKGPTHPPQATPPAKGFVKVGVQLVS
jgi:nuclear pore complex protein Nup98-Nup96